MLTANILDYGTVIRYRDASLKVRFFVTVAIDEVANLIRDCAVFGEAVAIDRQPDVTFRTPDEG